MKSITILLLSSLLSVIFSPVAIASENNRKAEKPKAVSTGDKIYTWTDQNGNTIYSDVPREGAKEMEIKKGTDYSTKEATPDWSTMKPKVITDEDLYSHFAIVSPSNEATVRNNDGNVQIALDIRPKLIAGHRVKLTMDGNDVAGSGVSFFSLNDVDRGTHTFVAYILSDSEEVLETSASVIVHMHRAIQNQGKRKN